jgi:distribution and morphology protein 31
LTGYSITFENAIVPRWREGAIRLGNVKIYCDDASWISLRMEQAAQNGETISAEEIDVNFTYLDLNVDSIDIKLSLWRWLDGVDILS